MSVSHPFNPAKLLWHRGHVELIAAGKATSAPVSVEWDLSNTCNHRCEFCSFGTPESQGYRFQHWQHFPAHRALSLVPELALAGVQSVTITGGGEPLMHPKAAEIFQKLTDFGLTWGLVTNGALLVGDRRDQVARHARFVRVSLDAGTPETHQLMHRPGKPEFDQILANMAAVVAASHAASRPLPLTVGASFCVTDKNYAEIGHAAFKVREAGGSYLEVRPTYPTTWRGDGWDMSLSNVSAAIDALEDARRAVETSSFSIIGMIDRFEALTKPDKNYAKCLVGGVQTIIGADGRLWHCCVQRGMPGFDLSSVLNQSFESAWAEAQAKRLQDVINVGKCPRCRYDNYNRILNTVKDDAMHLAFV